MGVASSYRIDILNTSGVKQAEISDYKSLSYVKRRNLPGECAFTVADTHTALSSLTDDCLVYVYRTPINAPTTWAPDFLCIYRGIEYVTERVGDVTIYCPGIMDILNDRIVAYPPASVNRSVFTSDPVETILHTLVKYNMTSSGTVVDGRVRLATHKYAITVGTDSAGGPTVDYWECAEKTLLDTLHELATQYEVAFNISYTIPTTFTWQYLGAGTSTPATNIFSIDRGNVSRITFTRDRREEKTVAIVGSTGEETLKNYDVRTGVNYVSTANDREMYVNVGTDDIDEIFLEGGRELSKTQLRNNITFDIMQTDSSRYKTDFDLNYVVTGRYKSTDYQLVVAEVSVNVENGRDNITARLEDI